MVALPADIAVTVPVDDTNATAVLLLFHDTFLLVALEGKTLALSVSLPPTVNDILDLLRLTPVTEMALLPVTVTEQVAVLLPSVVITVTVALPADIPITSPVDDTEATAELLLLHNTTLFAASDGETVAVKVSMPPTAIESALLLRDTSLTAIAVVEMVTVALQLLLLSAVEVALTTRFVAVSSSATVRSPFSLMPVSPPPPKTDHVTV
jgi:hypothetical protein